MVPRETMSKWQRKSVALNQVRWELEKILTEDITPDEKNTLKYRELVSAAYSALEHSVPVEHSREKQEEKQKKRKPWLTTMWYSLAAGAGGILAAATPYIIDGVRFVFKLFFGGEA